jgi:protocatechuate 3,4-dioxygenase beta subunit
LGALGIVAATYAVQSNDQPGRRDQPTKINSSPPEPNTELSKAAENDMKPLSVAGRVLDPDGKPFTGATIYVHHHHLYDRDRDAAPIESVAMAGADGRFRFELDPKKSDSSRGTATRPVPSQSWRGRSPSWRV